MPSTDKHKGADVDRILLTDVTSYYPYVAVKTARYWVETGKLRAFKPGRRVLVRRSDIERLIDESAK